jgi:transcription elongation factor SPT5
MMTALARSGCVRAVLCWFAVSPELTGPLLPLQRRRRGGNQFLDIEADVDEDEDEEEEEGEEGFVANGTLSRH